MYFIKNINSFNKDKYTKIIHLKKHKFKNVIDCNKHRYKLFMKQQKCYKINSKCSHNAL